MGNDYAPRKPRLVHLDENDVYYGYAVINLCRDIVDYRGGEYPQTVPVAEKIYKEEWHNELSAAEAE